MFRGIFIGIKRTLEALGIVKKLKISLLVIPGRTKIVLIAYDSSRNYELNIEKGIGREKIINREEITPNCSK
jgi:hypothetical protein